MSTAIHQPSKQTLVTNLRVADNFFSRLKGLMFTESLAQGHGLLISPCQQIHTHFMQYKVDVLFLDTQNQVVDIIQAMQPWRFSKYYKKAHAVLEVPAGSAEIVNIGDQIEIPCQNK